MSRSDVNNETMCKFVTLARTIADTSREQQLVDQKPNVTYDKMFPSTVRDFSVECEHYRSNFCGLNNNPHTVCSAHDVHPNISDDNPSPVCLIKRPIYWSLDEAAMAAANIILYHVYKWGNVEYGISIYGHETKEEYCLVETRQGDQGEVFPAYTVLGCPNTYLFKANVHSHPACGIQRFSDADYIHACGGKPSGKGNDLFLYEFARSSYINFLVGIQNIWLENCVYDVDELVIYNDTLWLAKTVPVVGLKPTDTRSGWINIKRSDVANDIGIKYNVHVHGSEILTKFTPPVVGEDRQIILHSKTKALAVIIAAKFHHKRCLPKLEKRDWAHLWDTIRKQYPKLPNIFGDYDWKNDIRLAIQNVIQQKPVYEIIQKFSGKLQQTKIKMALNNITWEDYYSHSLNRR
jgi:hypothetical protein